MTSGQTGFGFDELSAGQNQEVHEVILPGFDSRAVVHAASETECAAHQKRVDDITNKSGVNLWLV